MNQFVSDKLDPIEILHSDPSATFKNVTVEDPFFFGL